MTELTVATELENVTPSVESPSIWDCSGMVPLIGLFLSASAAIIKQILKYRAEIEANEAERIRWLEEQNDLLAKTLIGQKQDGN